MPAHAFFSFCIGFTGAVLLFALSAAPWWAVLIFCAAASAVSFSIDRPAGTYARACIAGFALGATRIAFFPDTLALSGAAFVASTNAVRAWAARFGSVFGYLYPEPIASFAQGILTGTAGMRIDARFMDALRATSTLHLIAVSGYNVTVVSSYAYRFFQWLTMPRKVIWILVLAFILLFVVFVGAPASAVRAGIMASLVVIAERFYRAGYARNALAFAAAVMLFIQPSAIFDLGFQLSFLATIGIVFVAPVLQTLGSHNKQEPSAFRELAMETGAAQSLVLPVLLLKNGALSLIGMAANFVVVPLIPAAMAISAVAGASALVFEPLGKIAAFVSLPFFAFLTNSIEWFASLPFASTRNVSVSLGWVVAYYAVLGVWVARRRKIFSLHA